MLSLGIISDVLSEVWTNSDVDIMFVYRMMIFVVMIMVMAFINSIVLVRTLSIGYPKETL